MISNYVVDSYQDAFGHQVFAREDTKNLILEALGETKVGLPKIAILENSYLVLNLECEKLNWKIYQRKVLILEGRAEKDGLAFNLQLDLPNGYYELELCNLEHTLLLVSAPARAYLPKTLFQKKHWGLTTQLYSIRKESFGDFSALKDLRTKAKDLGASFIGLNPLLASGYPSNVGISPYSPVSRHALNELYITSDLPKFKFSEIDYKQVADFKHKVLFSKFLNNAKVNRNVNPELLNYAVFSSLREQFGVSWQNWPEQFRNPNSNEVKKFISENQKSIDYFLYLQSLAKEELEALSSKNFDDLVLYLDFPVGVTLNSADVWADQSLFALQASAGAPPDELAPQGQSWGLPPMIPEELMARSCEPFIKALRFSMQFAGAIRIDHVMSLWRLYWAMPNQDGAYVRYPAEELTSIVKLESHLNKCVVIGEDLGTVPNETKEFMASSGVLSYKVFYFEKEGQEFKDPKTYPKESLCCVGTHDLATLKGFLAKTDLEERKKLQLHSEQVLNNLEIKRDLDLEALKRFLNLAELNFDEVLEKLHQKLLNSNSLLTALQLEDLLGQLSQVNLPGTVDERPNWKKTLVDNSCLLTEINAYFSDVDTKS